MIELASKRTSDLWSCALLEEVTLTLVLVLDGRPVGMVEEVPVGLVEKMPVGLAEEVLVGMAEEVLVGMAEEVLVGMTAVAAATEALAAEAAAEAYAVVEDIAAVLTKVVLVEIDNQQLIRTAESEESLKTRTAAVREYNPPPPLRARSYDQPRATVTVTLACAQEVPSLTPSLRFLLIDLLTGPARPFAIS